MIKLNNLYPKNKSEKTGEIVSKYHQILRPNKDK